MAHLKITFWQKKIDRESQLQASKGSKRHLLDHICARTFQGLHSVRLWTPTIFTLYIDYCVKEKLFRKRAGIWTIQDEQMHFKDYVF
jgi:hypothetical protein